MSLIDQHPLYAANIDTWELCRDATAGQKAIKAKTTDYLPDFVPSQGQDRYDDYLARAIYTNYTGRTKNRLIGSVFRKPPEIDIPTQLDYMLEDCTGTGLGLEQFAKVLAEDVFITGRGCVLVDYPEAEGTESREQVITQNLVPRLAVYKAEAVYNWQSDWIDGKEFLTQVRIEEMIEEKKDEFTVDFVRQYRVLDLFKGKYRQRIYDDKLQLQKEVFPKASGSTLDHIPFYFCGSQNNASDIDESPIYDLAVINIGHYQNSADYEDAVHRWSPTLFISSDISVAEFKEANPGGIVVGGMSGHFIGANGSATLLQMEPNTAAYEAMKLKEEQMAAFGANLFDFKGQSQTAEEARIKATSEASTLNIIVGNISECIQSALKDAALFVGVADYDVIFNLNTEFFPVEISTSEISSMVGLVEKGIIGLTDLRDKLRQTEVISPERSDDDLDADALIDPEQKMKEDRVAATQKNNFVK